MNNDVKISNKKLKIVIMLDSKSYLVVNQIVMCTNW